MLRPYQYLRIPSSRSPTLPAYRLIRKNDRQILLLLVDGGCIDNGSLNDGSVLIRENFVVFESSYRTERLG
jgi:hypothetical protein